MHLKDLRHLEMFGCIVEDPSQKLAVLGQMLSLESLMLFDGIADSDIPSLQSLEHLVDLYSDSAFLTTTSAKAFEKMTCNFYYLFFFF